MDAAGETPMRSSPVLSIIHGFVVFEVFISPYIILLHLGAKDKKVQVEAKIDGRLRPAIHFVFMLPSYDRIIPTLSTTYIRIFRELI